MNERINKQETIPKEIEVPSFEDLEILKEKDFDEYVKWIDYIAKMKEEKHLEEQTEQTEITEQTEQTEHLDLRARREEARLRYLRGDF